MEQKRSFLRKTWDFFRIAPVGEATILTAMVGFLAIASLNLPGFDLSILDKNDTLFTLRNLYELIPIGFALLGMPKVAEQFSLYRRLNNKVKQHGYRIEDFKTRINPWCSRQTAYVVADLNGYGKQYKELINQYEDPIHLKYLPNF